MRLTTALDEYKRATSERFPEENSTVSGAFSGHGDRLVHVSETGSLRDYSSSLSGLYGIDRSKLGIRTTEGTHWFADLEMIRQHYYRDTRLVETEYDAGSFTVHQYDLTLSRAHVTHVELRGQVPGDAHLVSFMTLAPEGKEAGVGALIHDNGGPDGSKVLEVYHRQEHDYVAASTGLDGVNGQRPEQFSEILSEHPVNFPRGEGERAYDETRLSGDFVVTAPLEGAGRSLRTTLVSQLSDHTEVDRGTALADLRRCALAHDTADSIRSAARDRTTIEVPQEMPRSSLVRTDLRVADLLQAPTGGHIAGPELDPFYANSGGYGYVWFRDDSELAMHLLDAGDRLDIAVDETVEKSAQFHCEMQLSDGTWPHRVWATDGSLAPGWANARVERNEDSREYQADQTASVTAFLATLLRERHGSLADDLTVDIRDTVVDAVDALIEDIDDDNDLPIACQNAWEDALGQFTHTAATYIQAFSAVARAPVRHPLQDRAMEAAERILDGLNEVWSEEQGAYPMRIAEGTPDNRLDVSTLQLVTAVREYDAIEDTTLAEEQLDRLAEHLSTTLNGLFRNPRGSQAAGLIRYEGDHWRIEEQDHEKIWSVSTGMGAIAAAEMGILLDDHGEQGDAYLDRAADLYELLDSDGPLTTDTGYLAEQTFDDGTLDSATPLGWSHALRLRATAILADEDALPSVAGEVEGPTDHPTWTTGEKYGLGTTADHDAPDPTRVWFTLTDGALTEARFPQVDMMNLRTLDFLVSANDDEYTVRTHNEARDAADSVERRVEPTETDALLFRHVFTDSSDGRGHDWELTVEYATDPEHDAILADVSFEADDDHEYDVFAVADAALTNTGTADRGLRLGEEGAHHLAARDPTAYTGDTNEPLLVDEDGEGYSIAMAMAASNRFDWATVGVAGSHRMRALFSEGKLPDPADSIDNENIVLIGRLGTGDTVESDLALGFARAADTAGALGEADGALDRGYETVRAAYADTWSEFLEDKELPASVADDQALADQYRSALMCLLAVEDKTYHGASIASPSVPWGEDVHAYESKGYGYNFVWSRDLYQVFSVFEIVDNLDIATNQLSYIYEFQQDEEGFIPQNTYLNGITRWGGEQMDNISFPQVMAYQLYQRGVTLEDAPYSYENIRRSADYVARNGPETAQERWEEESGFSPSSIATEIAGLACAGKLALETGREADALIYLSLADHWANNVEEWTATESGTERHENTPYYVRVTRDGDPEAGHLRTLANAGPTLDERDVIDHGFLELVRLGIKSADDSTMENSIKTVDETIRVEAGSAPGFYRYNGDGYGERARGDPGAPWSVDHKGKGRLWPLLTGERGEYELMLDDPNIDPADCLAAMQEFANSGRMISEQVWDRQHTTDYGWEFGEGTGAATPLAWSMAQYVRLAHGVEAGQPVETPEFVDDRYRGQELHEPDKSPALRVGTEFRGDSIVVSGETTGDRVAIKSPVEQTILDVEETEFKTTIDIKPGENQIIVAAGGEDPEASGTTVRRMRL